MTLLLGIMLIVGLDMSAWWLAILVPVWLMHVEEHGL